MTFDFEMIKKRYAAYGVRVDQARQRLQRPLTAAEKILFAHLSSDVDVQSLKRGNSYVDFAPDRIAMQDATAQMALLQFMQAGKEKVAVPSTVHADHLVQGKINAQEDLQEASITNKEVYEFLSSVSKKYGIGFWRPGAGIIHQVILENYAFPGGMMIGTDSHTPNAGGLGMVAIGVGGADAVDVMAGMPWELKFPKLIGVRLTGQLSGWVSAKDVILEVAGRMTVKGGTGAIVEYFGDGATSISCTGKATICNMGAEIGATCSLFGYDQKMADYLRATGRSEVADHADEMASCLTGDDAVYDKPEQYFDEVIDIDLSTLEPHINGPFTPDKAWTVSEMKEAVRNNAYPEELKVGLIGSCTNSSYEDMQRAASVLQQAIDSGLKVQSQLIINPGSEQVRYTAERDGLLAVFEKAGAVVFANACGPCIGQWDRKDSEKMGANSIVHSFNRNFAKRADGNPQTHAFVASPEIVAALAIAGKMTFNPLEDTLMNDKGETVLLKPPTGDELPQKGYAVEDNGYQAPADDGRHIQVVVRPDSDRLQLLSPFEPWNGEDIKGAYLLIKTLGKCTTDHISMAGPWLRYRGHLENISQNLLIGAVNAFNEESNLVKNQLTGHYVPVPEAALSYKNSGPGSIVIGDENYGEGSSREHAAMEPRFLGVQAVVVKSFARIHETNLKKQGVLALTFSDKSDYDKIQEDDRFDILCLPDFRPGEMLVLLAKHRDGSEHQIPVTHTYNESQIAWYRAGSALNLIAAKNV